MVGFSVSLSMMAKYYSVTKALELAGREESPCRRLLNKVV